MEEQNARYPITIDPMAQQAYLKASNTGADDEFGRSVAIHGDIVVVGAAKEDSSTTGVNSTPNETASLSGAAYICYIPPQEIIVEQPAFTNLPDDSATIAFSSPGVGWSSEPKTFTGRNAGDFNLAVPESHSGIEGNYQF